MVSVVGVSATGGGLGEPGRLESWPDALMPFPFELRVPPLECAASPPLVETAAAAARESVPLDLPSGVSEGPSWAVSASLSLLERLDLLDADDDGCCPIAGAWGWEESLAGECGE